MSTRKPRTLRPGALIRQDALKEPDFTLLVENAEIIKSYDFYSAVNRWFGLSHDDIQAEIPIVNKFLFVLGIIIGILMFSRGLIDGGLSVIGLWLRLLYFGIQSPAIALDDRFIRDKWTFLTPALSGLALTISQLIGMFIVPALNDESFQCDSFTTCL